MFLLYSGPTCPWLAVLLDHLHIAELLYICYYIVKQTKSQLGFKLLIYLGILTRSLISLTSILWLGNSSLARARTASSDSAWQIKRLVIRSYI